MLAGDSFERHHLLVLKAQVARALDLLPNVLGNQQLVGGREIRDAERLDHGLAEELIHVADRLAGVEANPLERQGLLERDAENSYLTTDAVSEDPMNQLLGHSITYRIALGPQAGRKSFALCLSAIITVI
jgi:hypothetical protein